MSRPEPMTKEEWVDFCRSTMHGPPTQETLYRIYATVDARDIELKSARAWIDRLLDDVKETKIDRFTSVNEASCANEQAARIGRDYAEQLEENEELKAEVQKLREACKELAARKEGEETCSVCGKPCYECDATPIGYLCSRCCQHPAEEECDRLRKVVNDFADYADDSGWPATASELRKLAYSGKFK